MEIGKSATKAIVLLLSGKIFTGNFFLASRVAGGLGPLDQKSWLRLCAAQLIFIARTRLNAENIMNI
jgi:hypothetical protein